MRPTTLAVNISSLKQVKAFLPYANGQTVGFCLQGKKQNVLDNAGIDLLR